MKWHLQCAYKYACIGLLFFTTVLSHAQLVITNQGGTPAAIINGFVGQGLVISNAVINCPTNAYGNFSNGNTTNLGVTNGAALTTGNLTQVSQAASNFMSTNNGTNCNDAQLNTLNNGSKNDCCILEFDLVPHCNQLSIRFVFGSEEYPNWVGSQYNDVFGFFITGPNPAGGNYTNQNIARLPNGTTVSINNINSGSNSSYYVNNQNGNSIVFGGFTTAITSSLNLVPCQTYHFKMAIADVSDRVFDSGVFIDFLQCTNITTLTMASTAASCGSNNGTASVSVSNGFPPFTYTWSPAPGAGQGTTNVSGLTAGTTYTVTVDDAYACIPPVTATVTIGGSPTPVITAPSNVVACHGDNIVATNFISTPVGANISWTNSNPAIGLAASGTGTIPAFTASNSTAAPITSTITVTPSFPNCPGNPITYTITINPLPTVALNSPTICTGNTATLTASPSIAGGNYSWSVLASTNTPSITVSPTVTTTYTVNYTLSGCSTSSSATVTVNDMPTVNVNSPTVCSGTQTTLTASPTVPGGTFSWSPSGLTTSSISVAATTTTTYNVTYTVNGCVATGTGTINVNPLPVVTIPSINICNGQTGTLTANVSVGGGNYYWTPGGFTSSSITVSPASTTSYTVTYTVNGCTGSASTAVVVYPPLALGTAGNNNICEGSSTNLSATAFNGNGGPYTYSWIPTSGLNNSNINNPTASPLITTTYTVTASDGCSQPITATVTVVVHPLPNPVFTADVTAGCAPLCVSFLDNTSIATGTITDWQWNFGDGNTSIVQNPKHCYNNPGIYSVTLTATSAARCVNTITYNNLINVYPYPIADFYAPVSNSILESTINFIDNSTGASTWDWNFGDTFDPTNNTSTLQNPTHTYSEEGSYCITLIVSNEHGCLDTTMKCISFSPTFSFYVPNAFTPNGDGINDEFFGKGENIKDFEMFIYDRWGNQIFHTDDINKHWDGRANNGSEVAQQDVYVYLIKLKDTNDTKHKYRGTVTLIAGDK